MTAAKKQAKCKCSYKMADAKMKCSKCGWIGTIHECEVDEEAGDLVCPKCGGKCGIWWD